MIDREFLADGASTPAGSHNQSARERIRRDSHLALGCGFGFALLVVGVLVVLLIIGQ